MIVDLEFLFFTWFFILSPFVLAILYPIAIQYERGGFWFILVPFVTFPTFLIDIFANATMISIIYGEMPFKYSHILNRREYTFSDRLERLVKDESHELYNVSVMIALWLNKVSPSKKHIKNI